MAKEFWIYCCPVIAALVVGFGYEQTAKPAMHLCKQPYALCTSAPCVPLPGDPRRATCLCDVEEGASMATEPCDSLRPMTDDYGVTTIYSTYSLKQYLKGKMAMKCPEGTPWSSCLNKRCTVDPENPKKAICVCDVVRTGEWMTLGGDCDRESCNSGYWSGALLDANEAANAFMKEALGLDLLPVNWCPAQES